MEAGGQEPQEIRKSDQQWRAELSGEQYEVLREAATEAPFSGALLFNKARGEYCCAGCGAGLFSSDHKFESGSGWPSFSEPAVAEALELRPDRSHFMHRTEVLCRRCGGHLGHVFDDGPEPSGQRFCINSAALAFHEEQQHAAADLHAGDDRAVADAGAAPAGGSGATGGDGTRLLDDAGADAADDAVGDARAGSDDPSASAPGARGSAEDRPAE